MEIEQETFSSPRKKIIAPEYTSGGSETTTTTELKNGLEELEIAKLKTDLANIAEQNTIHHPDRVEKRADHIIESTSTPEKHSLKKLWQISKDKEQSAEYFRQVLKKEFAEGRISNEQLTKFLQEAENFDFRVMFRDLAITYAVEVPSWIANLVGLGAYSEVIKPFLGTIGLSPAILPFISVSGVIRSPYLLFRTGQEFYKLAKQDGLKSAIKRLPYFGAANLINLVNLISPLGTLMVSFPRNKDVGLVFLNHRMQTSRAPGFLKKGVNKSVQWAIGFGKKKEKPILSPAPTLQPKAVPV